jgi:hypothetical protein
LCWLRALSKQETKPDETRSQHSTIGNEDGATQKDKTIAIATDDESEEEDQGAASSKITKKIPSATLISWQHRLVRISTR